MLIFYAYTPHDMETFNQNNSKIGSYPDDTDPRSTKRSSRRSEDRFAGAISDAVGPSGSIGSLLHEGDIAGEKPVKFGDEQ